MREARWSKGAVRLAHRNQKGALSPYLLEDTTFTLEEIRRWRAMGPSA